MATGEAMTFQWRPGLGKADADPQAVGEALEDLAARNAGVCPPRLVVQEARAPEHPMHNLLEWDDSVAATEYRVSQVRSVIRSLRIVHDGEPAGADSGPAYVHVKAPDRPEGYMRSDTALGNQQLRAAVLAEARQQLEGFQKRYRWLSELAPVFDAIDDVLPPEPE